MIGWTEHTSKTQKEKKYKYIILQCYFLDIIHGRIIKWNQHIGFLTLAGMAQVVEGNHGNDSKEG